MTFVEASTTIIYMSSTALTETIAFQVGSTYEARSSCDWDCVWSFTILERTAKFITFEDHGEVKKVGVRLWDGVEHASPLGRYSMAPVISADRPVV